MSYAHSSISLAEIYPRHANAASGLAQLCAAAGLPPVPSAEFQPLTKSQPRREFQPPLEFRRPSEFQPLMPTTSSGYQNIESKGSFAHIELEWEHNHISNPESIPNYGENHPSQPGPLPYLTPVPQRPDTLLSQSLAEPLHQPLPQAPVSSSPHPSICLSKPLTELVPQSKPIFERQEAPLSHVICLQALPKASARIETRSQPIPRRSAPRPVAALSPASATQSSDELDTASWSPIHGPPSALESAESQEGRTKEQTAQSALDHADKDCNLNSLSLVSGTYVPSCTAAVSKHDIHAKGGVSKPMRTSPCTKSRAATKGNEVPAKSNPTPPTIISRRRLQEILNSDDDNEKEFTQFLVRKDEHVTAGKGPKGENDLALRKTTRTMNMPRCSPRERKYERGRVRRGMTSTSR